MLTLVGSAAGSAAGSVAPQFILLLRQPVARRRRVVDPVVRHDPLARDDALHQLEGAIGREAVVLLLVRLSGERKS